MLFSVSIFLRLKLIKSNETEFLLFVFAECFFFHPKRKKCSHLGKHEALLKATNLFFYHIFFKYWYSWYFLEVKVLCTDSFLNDGDTECKQRKLVNGERGGMCGRSLSPPGMSACCATFLLSAKLCVFSCKHTPSLTSLSNTCFTVQHFN